MNGIAIIVAVILIIAIIIVILNIFFAYLPIQSTNETVNRTAANVDRAVARAEVIETKVDQLVDRADAIITEVERVGQDIATIIGNLETFFCAEFSDIFPDICNGTTSATGNVVSLI